MVAGKAEGLDDSLDDGNLAEALARNVPPKKNHIAVAIIIEFLKQKKLTVIPLQPPSSLKHS